MMNMIYTFEESHPGGFLFFVIVEFWIVGRKGGFMLLKNINWEYQRDTLILMIYFIIEVPS